MSTEPPEKLPGRSGVKVLAVTMLSMALEGKMSICTALRSGSGLGTSAPLRVVLL